MLQDHLRRVGIRETRHTRESGYPGFAPFFLKIELIPCRVVSLIVELAVITADLASQRLLQRGFQLARRHESFEFGANNPLAVHDEDPRLSE